MQLKRFETPVIAHYAYLLADKGVAAIIDPSRDVSVYLKAAAEMGVRIEYVLETHRQEDFVMGSKALASRVGAKIVNSGAKTFGHGDIQLADGATLELGAVEIRALHTPGHTPESICYAIFAAEDREHAWGVFTGDTLMYGDTGRTDLPGKDKQKANAEAVYDAVHEKLAPLGDGALVLPAHGPGSVCGSGMAERSSSTIGSEREYNAVFTKSRADFVRDKGNEELPRPPYFRHMEEVNLQGGLEPVSTAAAAAQPIDTDSLEENSARVLIDTRSPEAFCGAHIPDSFSVWLDGLPVFGGWIADHKTAITLITADFPGDVRKAVGHLACIGIDDVRALRGGFESWRELGQTFATAGRIGPQELADGLDSVTVLDVRETDEYAQGHIPGAKHAFVGHLEDELDGLGLAKDDPIVVTCGVGHRASIAVSIFLRHGFTDVRNLLGGMQAWSARDLPIDKD